MDEACPLANTECRQARFKRGCYQDTHHLYWPSSLYRTAIEKAFRELDENKVKLCRSDHNEVHAEQPPLKPPYEEMVAAIGNAALQEAV